MRVLSNRRPLAETQRRREMYLRLRKVFIRNLHFIKEIKDNFDIEGLELRIQAKTWRSLRT